MKLLLVIVVLMLLASVGLVALIEKDPGYVLISYQQLTLETSVWVGLVLLIVSFFALYFLLRLIRRVMKSGGILSHWLSDRQYGRSQRLTSLGMVSFIEGNWQKSRRILLRAVKGSDAPLLNYLIAARASNQLGDSAAVSNYLKQAEESEAGAGIAVELTQAELQLNNGQLEQALATLVRARKNTGKHPYVLRLLMDVYLGLEDWQQLAVLLPELKKHKVVEGDRWLKLQSRCFLQLMENTDVVSLKQQWKAVPENLKKDSAFVVAYINYLREAGDEQEAEQVAVKRLKQSWSDELVHDYGLLAGTDVKKQLLTAEKWLKERPNNPQLLLCLGRLSLRNELWGKAREYFESSFKLEQRPETCAELGRLLASLKEVELSNQYFQKGLLLSEKSLPKLPQPEQHQVQVS